MRNRTLRSFAACLLAVIMLVPMASPAYAASVGPNDAATEGNVLEVLRQYDAGAYHIMKTESDSGSGFLFWFMGKSIIEGIDTAVHETYHSYTFQQSGGFYTERIYLGDGISYDVDYSAVYKSDAFTKTEEMAGQIPSQLQTLRYGDYVAPGSALSSNENGVFGLLNEFTAYYWGLRTMNSLTRFLLDTGAGADAWKNYAVSVANNMTAYTEFKFWTLRYMMHIRSANPALYQAILSNGGYCGAYRDAEEKFASELAKSREIVSSTDEYLRAKGFRIDWSNSGIYLRTGNSGVGLGLGDYNVLTAELGKAEYVEMDSILKAAGAAPAPAFADVAAGAWYAGPVAWAVEKGITNGTANTTFSPGQACTHAHILTFLYRAARGGGAASAEDMAAAVSWAYSKGMIDSSFDPGAVCTRSQAVHYIWQAMDRPSAQASFFADVPAGAPYAGAVDWAVAAGVTNGDGGPDTFSPNQECTRGHIVTFLYRAYNS